MGSMNNLHPKLVIFISTCPANELRRKAIRRSWLRFLRLHDSPLSPEQRASVDVVFIAARSEEMATEAEAEGDILFLDAPEGYGHLWRKALTFLQLLVAACEHQQSPSSSQALPAPPQGQGSWQPSSQPDFVMHADDDSYVRLDLLLAELVTWPRTRHYWGYIWDGTGARCTAPIRNPVNKSYMPAEQYPLDYYPPFASGCGFVLSWDLVLTLAAAAPTLPDYRLLDPPFGIHLCGPPELCLLPEPVVPVHDERVRPYRPMPTFRSDTIVQHYLRAEELAPFHSQVMEDIAARKQGLQGPLLGSGSEAAKDLYDQLVALGLLRR